MNRLEQGRTTGPRWHGTHLYLGQTCVGLILKGARGWTGICHLPGGLPNVARDTELQEAHRAVVHACNQRMKAMLGAGMKTATAAVDDGRALRSLARKIWRAGVWACDREIDAQKLFKDLGHILTMPADNAPFASGAGFDWRSDKPPKVQEEGPTPEMIE